MKKLLIIIAIISLSGCAEKSRFDCPYGKGPSCISMSEIDKNIKNNTVVNSCGKTNCSTKNADTAKKPAAKIPGSIGATPASRIPEVVLQMWISPYEANKGIYYQASFINIIVKDASWAAPNLDDASTREAYNG